MKRARAERREQAKEVAKRQLLIDIKTVDDVLEEAYNYEVAGFVETADALREDVRDIYNGYVRRWYGEMVAMTNMLGGAFVTFAEEYDDNYVQSFSRMEEAYHNIADRLPQIPLRDLLGDIDWLRDYYAFERFRGQPGAAANYGEFFHTTMDETTEN